MFISRIVRVTLLGLACTAGLIALLLAPDLLAYFVPEGIRAYWAEALALFCVIAYAIARHMSVPRPTGRKSGEWARVGLKWLDLIVRSVLHVGPVTALGVLCFGLLLAWIPHYLTWPFSRDHETFAVLAQSWDQGILPYRDIRTFNFPGAIYLDWILGKVFGWGQTVPLYAFDAACVLLLGAVLVIWSRRCLNDAVPGLIAYVAFLSCYLNYPFEVVIERDWQTALLVCLGLLFMQGWPGRSSRVLSALAFALALAFRPHAVLFLPALAWEVARGADGSATGWSGKIRTVAAWSLCCGVFVTMTWAPLLAAGIADDLVRGLRVAAYGGPYSQATPSNVIGAFLDQFKSWKNDVPLVATLLLAARRRDRSSGMAQTWALAWLGALVYQPIHPVHHFYVLLPMFVVGSITWALVVSQLLPLQRSHPAMFVLSLVLLVYEIMPVYPSMCSFDASFQALGPLLDADIPTKSPPGCRRVYPVELSRWESYRQVLLYLRRETGAGTMVANMINTFPYDTVNGPTGRLSPFLADAGICWMSQVDVDLDSEFAESLFHCTDSVVVWASDQTSVEPRLRLRRVVAVIREHYEPAARFGQFEIWRRKGGGRR